MKTRDLACIVSDASITKSGPLIPKIVSIAMVTKNFIKVIHYCEYYVFTFEIFVFVFSGSTT